MGTIDESHKKHDAFHSELIKQTNKIVNYCLNTGFYNPLNFIIMQLILLLNFPSLFLLFEIRLSLCVFKSLITCFILKFYLVKHHIKCKNKTYKVYKLLVVY